MNIISRILSALARFIVGLFIGLSVQVWVVIAFVLVLLFILIALLYAVFSSPNAWTNLFGMGVFGQTQLAPGATANYRVIVTTKAPDIGETYAVEIYEEDTGIFDGDDLLHRIRITITAGETQGTVPFSLSCSTEGEGADDLIGSIGRSEDEPAHRIYAYFDAPFVPNIESPRKTIICQAE